MWWKGCASRFGSQEKWQRPERYSTCCIACGVGDIRDARLSLEVVVNVGSCSVKLCVWVVSWYGFVTGRGILSFLPAESTILLNEEVGVGRLVLC